jgi:hypothetical protein
MKKGVTYAMIRQQRQSLCQSPLRVNVPAYKPRHEDEEESAEDHPFDNGAFLELCQLESFQFIVGRGTYFSIPKAIVAITPHSAILVLYAVSLLQSHTEFFPSSSLLKYPV